MPKKKQLMKIRGISGRKSRKRKAGNTFYVQISRVKNFKLYIHRQMVQIDQNVKVYLNNKLVFDERINLNKKFIIGNYLKNSDLSLLYINKINISL